MNQRLRFLLICFAIFTILAACQGEDSTPPTPALNGEAAVSTQPTPSIANRTETVESAEPTAVPDYLAWEYVGDSDSGDLPPYEPLLIRFNQPMAVSLPRPLRFSPPVSGEFKWSDNRTLLTFTPNSAFSSNRVYRVELDPRLESETGLKPTSVTWQFHTQYSPRITSRTPNSLTLTERQPSFDLTFIRAMNHESVAEALQMEPAVPYELAWNDDILTLSLAEPLDFETEYTFTIANSAADADGRRLAQPYSWTVQLARAVNAISWPTAANHLAPITIQFNYPMNRASVSSALKIEPAISGKFAWNDDDTRVELTPNSQLPADTAYTLSFSDDLRDAAGFNIPAPEAMAFTTSPVIISATPRGSSNHPAGTIRIRFDRLMDAATTEAAFQIEPATTGSFHWEETTLIFTPEDGYLAENSRYTITVADTALSADGQQIMNRAYSWEFSTKELEDVANFGYGPNAQVLDMNGRRAIQFQAFRRSELQFEFELYQLTMPQFLDRYSSGFHGWLWQDQGDEGINLDGTELVAAWQMTSTDPLQEWANVQETILPDEIGPGLYILNLIAGNVNDQLILIVTENVVAVKQADEQLLVWVTDINDAPVPNTAVTIYARNGNVLASGQANEEGLFATELLPFEEGGPPATEPLIVAAQVGDDVTLTGLSGEWQSSSGQYDWQSRRPRDAQSAAFVFTERPIYKPGQTVYFKAILRLDDDALLSVPPEGTAVTIRIRDARNNVVQTQELTTNGFGTVNGSFQIAEGATLGVYTVEATLNGEAHSQIFKVEDYRKPDYDVSVTTDAAVYTQGDTVEVTVDTAYFFGEPVVNAEITLRRFQVAPDWYTPGLYSWYELYGVSNLRGTTDENGRATFSFQLRGDGLYFGQQDWQSSLGKVQWGIEATVDDGSRQTVSGHAILTIYDATEYISVDAGSYVQEPGVPFAVNATVQTIFDEPVANRQLELTLRRWNHSSYEYDIVVQSVALSTNENGRANLNFTIEEPGYYQLRIAGTDGQGEPMHYNTWVYAFSNFYSSWYGSDSGNLNIEADQPEYRPGDVAQLLVESTFSGPALLTVERGTIRRQELVELTAPVTMIPLTIEEGDVPNVYVAINAWQEQETELTSNTSSNLPDSNLLTSYVNLSVPAFTKQLNVTITPDQAEYAPGEEATFTVRVTNYRGEPVSAEVSLALVDEAIFALSPELNGAMYDDFYYERSSIVRTYNGLQPIRYLWEGGFGGGGDGGLSGNGPRQDFPDTAVWEPVLYTDFNGEVSVTVTLPDSLTSWRATAKATTADTQVGEAIANVITRQDVIVRPLLPRILTAGDTMALSAIVHNYSDEAQTLEVTLETGDLGLEIGGEAMQTIIIQPGQQQIVGWPVDAVEAGKVDVVITAVPTFGSGPGDAILLPLTIQPLAVPDVTTEVGQFTSQHATTVIVPADALPMSQVELQLSRSIAGSLLEGLQYLTGYPYGCVEQTMSKALPNAVVGRALNQLGVTNPTLQAELPGQINASIQRLYGFQHTDGGWGWWYDDASHDYQTAWVIFGLAQVADAGYEIDPGVIERGVSWLNQERPYMDSRTRAFALYAMALAGLPNEEATLALHRDRDELNGDEFSLAALALTLHTIGEDGLAAELLAELEETAVSENNDIYWEGSSSDGYYNNKVMASDIRTTAIALSAYSQIQPNSELIPGAVRWLMAQRRSQGWGSTNETSFAILGLTDHLLATSFNEAVASTGYTVQVNGETVASGTLDRGAPAVSLTIPIDNLQVGENEIVLTQDGGGRLYFVLNGRMFLPREQIEAAGNVQITRTYLDAETGELLETIEPGQLVEVRLKVDLPSQGSYIIIEDQLPGGLEALNEGLAITSHAVDAYSYGSPTYSWQELGYNYKEVRGDRVTFFITEVDGRPRTITYMARATQTGSFTAMPAEVYAMYDATVWGRSASDQIVIAFPE
ncbi:Ig-like domain-containing protein [Candidatus Leptofilum sp.]|uniref:Ig-like domain-containing protein n=1 Tax=Candidatus Leptofilum sp. TaxID=3241576 RepID=UPI003B5B078A